MPVSSRRFWLGLMFSPATGMFLGPILMGLLEEVRVFVEVENLRSLGHHTGTGLSCPVWLYPADTNCSAH